MVNAQLSKNLRALRDHLGLRQEDIAREINISRQAYSNYENGTRSPSGDTLILLSRFHGYTVDELLTKNINPNHPNVFREEMNPNYCGLAKEDVKYPEYVYMSEKEIDMVLLTRDLPRAEFDTIYTMIASLSGSRKNTDPQKN